MPKIKWSGLSAPIRFHLYERAIKRKISKEDPARLQEWVQSNPEAPNDDWYKDFGTFKLCGRGENPLTFLEPGQVAYGKKIV
jgi:hypothetical protein